MLTGAKPLSIESVKFAIDSYKKITKAEEVARLGELDFNVTNIISCKMPPHSERTPDKEFSRNRSDRTLWALYEHGRCVANFDADLLESLKTLNLP